MLDAASLAGAAACCGGAAGARHWSRAGRFAVELRDEPIEAVEIVLQTVLGIVLRVSEDADPPAIAARANRSQHFEIESALAQAARFSGLSARRRGTCR